jgi:predicted ATPase
VAAGVNMIKSIWIDNFKSLVDFELPLSKFTCLVGLNGAGKSTVLQAMDFISQLMVGDLDDWLQRRQWDSSDINSKLTKDSNIDFKLIVELSELGEVVWSGSINRTTLRCTQEKVSIDHINYLKVESGHCILGKYDESRLSKTEERALLEKITIMFEYQGSILSQLKSSQTTGVLYALKHVVSDIHSLDLLSPEMLRSRTKASNGELGLGGEKLSAFIHESGKEGKNILKNKLAKVYGQLDSIDTRSLRSGWKQLEITEHYKNKKLKTIARHMNDGMLRLMAILSQLESDSKFILFDEIENGINPELVEFLIDHLVNAKYQIMVTTHSPMVLNFLEDADAKQGVIYLYKTDQGFTKSIKMFEIPSMAKKLEFMGPGEAFIDTDLTVLYKEIATLQ